MFSQKSDDSDSDNASGPDVNYTLSDHVPTTTTVIPSVNDSLLVSSSTLNPTHLISDQISPRRSSPETETVDFSSSSTLVPTEASVTSVISDSDVSTENHLNSANVNHFNNLAANNNDSSHSRSPNLLFCDSRINSSVNEHDSFDRDSANQTVVSSTVASNSQRHPKNSQSLIDTQNALASSSRQEGITNVFNRECGTIEGHLTDDSCLGAVGGEPLPLTSFNLSGKWSHAKSTQEDVDNNRAKDNEVQKNPLKNEHEIEKDVLCIASALSSREQHCCKTSLNNDRLQDESNEVNDVSSEATNNINIDNKKKKLSKLKAFFVGHSSSSELSDDSMIDKKDSPRSSTLVPHVKKKRSVKRFLKSVLLSDSSSSDWSANESDNEEDTTDNDVNDRKQGLKNISPLTQNSTSSDTSVSPSDLEQGRTDEGILHDHYSLSNPISVSHGWDTQPSNSSSENASIVYTHDIKSVTSSSTDSLSSGESNTIPKEFSVSPNDLQSVKKIVCADDSQTQQKVRISNTDETLSSNNYVRGDNIGAKYDLHQTQSQRLCLQELDNNHQSPVSHYDNIHKVRHPLGMSELADVVAPIAVACISETSYQPTSSLPVDLTCYNNMEVTPSQQPGNVRTLYDNITDAELAHCQLQMEASDSEIAAEIENLKTGFEDSGTAVISSQSEPLSFTAKKIVIEPGTIGSSLSVNEQMPIGTQTIFDDHEGMAWLPLSNPGPDAGAIDVPKLPPPTQTKLKSKQSASFYDNMSHNTHQSQKSCPRGNLNQPQTNAPVLPQPRVFNQNLSINDSYKTEVRCGQIPDHQQEPASSSGSASIPQSSATQTHPDSNATSLYDGGAVCQGTSPQKISSLPSRGKDKMINHKNNHANTSNYDESDSNNNVDGQNVTAAEEDDPAEEDDDVNDEDTDPQTRMLHPRRKPRSKFRRFITSLLSLSSSSDDDEPYYTVNPSSSSVKPSDWS